MLSITASGEAVMWERSEKEKPEGIKSFFFYLSLLQFSFFVTFSYVCVCRRRPRSQSPYCFITRLSFCTAYLLSFSAEVHIRSGKFRLKEMRSHPLLLYSCVTVEVGIVKPLMKQLNFRDPFFLTKESIKGII